MIVLPSAGQIGDTVSKESILEQFQLFSLGGEGIGGWLNEQTDGRVFDRLSAIQEHPLTRSQFNQLLALGHQGTVSPGFFRYYWLECPTDHPYAVDQLSDFSQCWFTNGNAIVSLDHLRWGLTRLFTDALLYYGNVRTAFRALRTRKHSDLADFFMSKKFDTLAIKSRGPALPLRRIPQDDRYLVSEMACKSFGDTPETDSEMRQVLRESYRRHQKAEGGPITFRDLISGNLPKSYKGRQRELELSMGDVLGESISSESDFEKNFGKVADRFFRVRCEALNNTHQYLSMVNELDIYVATSMRKREDFRAMARFCDKVFLDQRLSDLHLRYFDPTMSAAQGHEDKGLIECLMVKCAKVLLYCAGEKESYGKDAEAAMALSLGKPVIFYCDEEPKARFYREVHPLSRLIEFETGVAVGAMIADSEEKVIQLLLRLLENRMQYQLEPHPSREGYLLLKEQLTDSVVRLQTNDQMLTETFWNHYHNTG